MKAFFKTQILEGSQRLLWSLHSTVDHWCHSSQRQKHSSTPGHRGVNQDRALTPGWRRQKNFMQIASAWMTTAISNAASVDCGEPTKRTRYLESGLFTSEILESGDLLFLTWPLTQWPVFHVSVPSLWRRPLEVISFWVWWRIWSPVASKLSPHVSLPVFFILGQTQHKTGAAWENAWLSVIEIWNQLTL